MRREAIGICKTHVSMSRSVNRLRQLLTHKSWRLNSVISIGEIPIWINYHNSTNARCRFSTDPLINFFLVASTCFPLGGKIKESKNLRSWLEEIKFRCATILKLVFPVAFRKSIAAVTKRQWINHHNVTNCERIRVIVKDECSSLFYDVKVNGGLLAHFRYRRCCTVAAARKVNTFPMGAVSTCPITVGSTEPISLGSTPASTRMTTRVNTSRTTEANIFTLKGNLLVKIDVIHQLTFVKMIQGRPTTSRDRQVDSEAKEVSVSWNCPQIFENFSN